MDKSLNEELPQCTVANLNLDSQIFVALIAPHLAIEPAGWQEYLTSYDQQEFAAHTNSKSKNERLRARAIFRYFLRALNKSALVNAELQKTTSGKPYFPDEILKFNLSHSQGYIALAFSNGCEVGIDIEASTMNMEKVNRLAKRVLSAEEQLAIQQLPCATQQVSLFLRSWTLKEALLKCEGCGISKDLSAISFPTCAKEFSYKFENQLYRLKDLTLSPEVGAAIAHQPKYDKTYKIEFFC